MEENLSNKDHIEILDNPKAELKSQQSAAQKLKKFGFSEDEIEEQLLIPKDTLFPPAK